MRGLRKLPDNAVEYVETASQFLKNYLPMPEDHIKPVVIVSVLNAVGGIKALNNLKEMRSHILTIVGELRDNCTKVLGEDENYTVNIAMDGLLNKFQVF